MFFEYVLLFCNMFLMGQQIDILPFPKIEIIVIFVESQVQDQHVSIM